MTTKSFAQIMTERVFIPVSARNWETIDLPVSKNLKLLFNNYQYETLEDLHGKSYGELFINAIFNQRFITELFELLNLFTSADGFRTLEFQVSIAKQKRIVAVESRENSTTSQSIDSLNIPDNEYDISQRYPHTVEKAVNQQNEASDKNENDQYEHILEITDIATKHLTSGHSISHEFKDIFELMEIDETSDFLQFKSENTQTKENNKLPEITGDEIISIPAEYRDVPILTLDVSVRLDNVLRSLNIQTLGDLDRKPISEIKHTKNCGQKTVDELCNLVEKLEGVVKNEGLEETVFTNKVNRKIVVPESLEKLPIKNLDLSVRLTNILEVIS